MTKATRETERKADPAPTALKAEAAPNLPAVRHDAPAPSRARRWWIGGGVGLVLLALGGLAYVQFWMPGPPLVAVEIVAPSPVTRVLAVNGRIAAERSVDVRSVVSGTLIELPVAEGDRVAEGQVVARVDAAAQNALVRQAMAGLDAALVARQRAVEAYDRNVALGSNVSRTVLENSALDVEAATQEVARQTAVVDQASIILDSYTIRAPGAGQVLTLDAEQGQIVGPTTPLMTIADPGALVVEADVDEAYATQIALGQPAVLQLAGETGTHAGRIAYVSSRVDADTGGLAVRIAFDEAVAAPIGLTVATNIIVEQREAALTVPRTALRADATGQGVFVVSDGVAQLVPLGVVDWPAARLIVTEGLAEGAVVIVDATGIADGQAVAVAGR